MKKAIHLLGLACAAALFAAPSLFAMDHDSACMPKNYCAYGLIGPGISWVNLERLNDNLAASGASTFRQYTPTLVLGGHKEADRMIMESFVTGLFWKDRVNAGLRTSVWLSNIMWNSGFNVLPASLPAIAFPFLGIGAGVNGIQVRSDKKKFSDILLTKEPNTALWQAAFLLNAGAGADLRIPMGNKPKGAVIGLRAGYTFDPFLKSKWRSEGTIVSDVPPAVQSGAFIKLVLGGWGGHMHDSDNDK